MTPTPQFTSAAQNTGVKSFHFDWNEIPGAVYNLYRDNVLLAANQAALNYDDSDIEYDRQYLYALTAVLDDVESDRSVPVFLTATSAGQPFATSADLAAYWRTLTADEITRADKLCEVASNRLRLIAGVAGVDLDAKKAASPVYASVLQTVVMEAVKRAMITPTDQPAAQSYQQTAGPYSENITYANPTGDIYFKKNELSDLGLSGNQTLRSIRTTKADIYGS